MPDLGAKTQATPGIGLHPGFAEEGANLFNAVAATQGAQYYQYTGNTEQPYRLTCTLSGSGRGVAGVLCGTELDVLAVGNCYLRKEDQDPALKQNYETAFELD